MKALGFEVTARAQAGQVIHRDGTSPCPRMIAAREPSAAGPGMSIRDRPGCYESIDETVLSRR